MKLEIIRDQNGKIDQINYVNSVSSIIKIILFSVLSIFISCYLLFFVGNNRFLLRIYSVIFLLSLGIYVPFQAILRYFKHNAGMGMIADRQGVNLSFTYAGRTVGGLPSITGSRLILRWSDILRISVLPGRDAFLNRFHLVAELRDPTTFLRQIGENCRMAPGQPNAPPLATIWTFGNNAMRLSELAELEAAMKELHSEAYGVTV